MIRLVNDGEELEAKINQHATSVELSEQDKTTLRTYFYTAKEDTNTLINSLFSEGKNVTSTLYFSD